MTIKTLTKEQVKELLGKEVSLVQYLPKNLNTATLASLAQFFLENKNFILAIQALNQIPFETIQKGEDLKNLVIKCYEEAPMDDRYYLAFYYFYLTKNEMAIRASATFHSVDFFVELRDRVKNDNTLEKFKKEFLKAFEDTPQYDSIAGAFNRHISFEELKRQALLRESKDEKKEFIEHTQSLLASYYSGEMSAELLGNLFNWIWMQRDKENLVMEAITTSDLINKENLKIFAEFVYAESESNDELQADAILGRYYATHLNKFTKENIVDFIKNAPKPALKEFLISFMKNSPVKNLVIISNREILTLLLLTIAKNKTLGSIPHVFSTICLLCKIPSSALIGMVDPDTKIPILFLAVEANNFSVFQYLYSKPEFNIHKLRTPDGKSLLEYLNPKSYKIADLYQSFFSIFKDVRFFNKFESVNLVKDILETINVLLKNKDRFSALSTENKINTLFCMIYFLPHVEKDWKNAITKLVLKDSQNYLNPHEFNEFIGAIKNKLSASSEKRSNLREILCEVFTNQETFSSDMQKLKDFEKLQSDVAFGLFSEAYETLSKFREDQSWLEKYADPTNPNHSILKFMSSALESQIDVDTLVDIFNENQVTCFELLVDHLNYMEKNGVKIYKHDNVKSWISQFYDQVSDRISEEAKSGYNELYKQFGIAKFRNQFSLGDTARTARNVNAEEKEKPKDDTTLSKLFQFVKGR